MLERYVDSVTLLPGTRSTTCSYSRSPALTPSRKATAPPEHIGAISLACNMTGAADPPGYRRRSDRRTLPDGFTNGDRRFTQVGRWGFSGPELQTFATCSTCERMASNASQLRSPPRASGY